MKKFLLVTATVISAVFGTLGHVAAGEQMVIIPAPLYVSFAAFFCKNEKDVETFYRMQKLTSGALSPIQLVVKGEEAGMYCPYIMGEILRPPTYAYSIKTSSGETLDVFRFPLPSVTLYTWQVQDKEDL